MATPTRYPRGVNTTFPDQALKDYPLPNPIMTGRNKQTDVATYVYDMLNAPTASEYTIVGSGSTFGLEGGIGGYAVITPGGATTATSIDRSTTSFAFQANNQLWFSMRFIPGAFATTATYAFGLRNGTTDGLYLTKAPSTNAITLVSNVNSVATTLATTTVSHTVGTLTAGATTARSQTVTVASTAALSVGMYVYGAGIPVNSVITAIASSTSMTINQPATATATGLTLTYAMPIEMSIVFDGTNVSVFQITRAGDSLVARAYAPSLTTLPLAPFISFTPTATDLIHLDYVFTAQEIQR